MMGQNLFLPYFGGITIHSAAGVPSGYRWVFQIPSRWALGDWTLAMVSDLREKWRRRCPKPIGSMYAIYGNIYHQYTPNVSIYTIHGSYG